MTTWWTGMQLDGGDAERTAGAPGSGPCRARGRCRAARSGTSGCSFGQALDVALVDHRAAPRRARRTVVSPAERGLGHDALRHARPRCPPGSPTRSAARVAGVVAEERVAPADRAAERARVGIDEQLRRVEAVARPPGSTARGRGSRRAGRGGRRAGRRARRSRRARAARMRAVSRASPAAVEQAELDGGRVLREEGEVDPFAVPGGAERIRLAGPDAHAAALVSEPAASDAKGACV